MLRNPTYYWSKDVSFHLDGVSFVYKLNPLSDARHARGGVGQQGPWWWKTSSFHGGYCLWKRRYTSRAICENKCRLFWPCLYDATSPTIFQIPVKAPNDSKIFVLDNDSSQTSAKTRAALEQLCITMQRIPPQSPDLNPIENMFHEMTTITKLAAKQNNVQHQILNEFVSFVKFTVWATSESYVGKTILNMPKRLKEIYKGE